MLQTQTFDLTGLLLEDSDTPAYHQKLEPEFYQFDPILNFNFEEDDYLENTNLEISKVTSVKNCEETNNSKKSRSVCNITNYLSIPQLEAAKSLGVPASTLSARWKEAEPLRKWPFRMVQKIDKEICTILEDVPPNGSIPDAERNRLAILICKRNEELRPVVIRL